MKITALLENTTKRNALSTEHGLSLYIETADHRILFDMGQTDLFAKNAATLDVDLSTVDLAILSHGHYDHGGGLATFLEINRTAPVYLSRYAFGSHYHGTDKYIGLDITLAGSNRLIFTEDTTVLDDGMTLYTCSQKKQRHYLGNFGLTRLENGVFLPEDFRHEQYLLLEENNKKILFSGCSHRGIMDITDWFHPDILIGGFHFSKLPLDDTLKSYAEYLNGFSTEYYTCHCTGEKQLQYMKKHMNKLHGLSCGETIYV